MNEEQAALRTQLAELNARARAYASRLWQVPFAYIALYGAGLIGVADDRKKLALTFLVGCFFGIVVFIHMIAMLEGSKRAVENIQKVEKRLGLEQTALHLPGLHMYPLMSIVVLTILFSFFALVQLIVCSPC